MKKIFSIILSVLILGCVVTFSSCSEDFLIKEPPASLAGSVMESSIGVEGMLIGAYAHTTRSTIFGGAMGTDWVYASAASDDMYKGTTSTDQASFNQVERYEVLVNLDYLNERWRECFNGASRCNATLDFLKLTQANAPNAITDSRANQIKGEALYLRAWFHFSANRIWKKIPYIRTIDEMDGKLPEEISNSDAGWTYMEADLKFAIANLPNSWPSTEVGRATKYAAETLLAQVYLYQGNYSAAAPLLQDVIDNSGKSLVSNYYDNYNERTENNAESIFELQCSTSPTGQSSMRLSGACAFTSGPVSVGGWGFYQPTACLIDAFRVNNDGIPYLDIIERSGPIIKSPNAGYPGSPGKSWMLPNDMGLASSDPFDMPTEPVDPRLDWSFARRGVDYLGWGMMAGQSWIREQANGGPWGQKKFTHFQANQSAQNGSGFNNDRNFRYHRLAHVLLWRAECHVAANELDQARVLVNMVRERAKNTPRVMGFYNGNTFGGHTLTADERALIDWDKPAANYKCEPYAAFTSQEMAREAVRMEIRLEFASEGQRFFDLRRWGQNDPPVNGKPYDEYVLQDFIERDQQFRIFMNGATYNKDKRYWPIPLTQLDLQPGVLSQINEDECKW